MTTTLQTPFNAAQVEILKLFAQGLTDAQLNELRNLLIDFRFNLLDEQIKKVAEQKGLTISEIEATASSHLRTPYKSKNHSKPEAQQKVK